MTPVSTSPPAPHRPLSTNTSPPVEIRAPRQRIDSVDLLRGLVMAIMVLDHTRDFAFAGTMHMNPLDLSRTTTAIFFTRWITHYCAPVFVLLAGCGAYLQRSRGKPVPELSRFLLTRGAWLIVLEFTLVRTGLTFSLDYHVLGIAQVIWAIGVAMIVLAGLVYLPPLIIGAFGAVLIVFHNLLDQFPVYGWHGPDSSYPTLPQALWTLLHGSFQALPLGHPFPLVIAGYALIPWVAVMAVGYALGTVYDLTPTARRSRLLWIGGGLVAAFCLVRAINGYGDPSPWSAQQTPWFTVLSFVNTTKYPASLDFLLMTLGPAFIALALFEWLPPSRLTAPLITIGRVPLFFYILQWYVPHILTILLALAAHKDPSWLFAHFPFRDRASDAGFSLRTTYAIWFASLLILYPMCSWFAGVKRRRRDWWLSYL